MSETDDRAMTAPEQMRALAAEAHDAMSSMITQIEGEWGKGHGIDTLRQQGDEDVLLADRVAAALRDAADQLEAVQEALTGGSVATPMVVRVAEARRALDRSERLAAELRTTTLQNLGRSKRDHRPHTADTAPQEDRDV
ncbi:hypothetical protein [Curtobacterium sp. SORGH_AS_0776]|uniref:hypothetical protein n=1 Tax=Curtobacterium sp. SORGH_AS_0776 TaxID=3041798 RepID=UPI00285F510F|nr:hypothetical protein [Curtobacterium sp. SORGH_AS_0776]MDR6172670.1 hypothetical protein [Curtobacterium sp. SORGH_AS_0776]